MLGTCAAACVYTKYTLWSGECKLPMCEEEIKPIELRKSFITRSAYSDFDQEYEILEKLGEGGFAKIYKVRHRETGCIRVAKVVRMYSKTDLRIFRNEVAVLSSLDSPYVTRIVSYYLDDERPFSTTYKRQVVPTGVLVTQYIPGIDLLDSINEHLSRKSSFTEPESWTLACEMIKAVAHVNQSGFVHRDIKPENFVLADAREAHPRLKLIDFGLASPVQSAPPMTESGGTTFYMAPETAYSSCYTEMCDSWSIGVILAILVSGGSALVGRATSLGQPNKRVVSHDAVRSELEKLKRKGVSVELVALIRDLMAYEPPQRLSAVAALDRLPTAKPDSGALSKVRDNISRLRQESEFARLVKSLLVHLAEDTFFDEAEKVFRSLDQKCYARLHFIRPSDGDPCKCEEVSYSEFLSSCIDISSEYTQKLLEYIFMRLAGPEQRIDATNLSSYFIAIDQSSAKRILNSCIGPTGKESSLNLESFMKCVKGIE